MLQKSCKKVHGNNVGFQPSKLRQKKYVEATCIFRLAKLQRKSTWKITWKFFKIWSYRRNIHTESTSIPRGVPVRVAFPFNMQFIAYSFYYFLNPKLFLICFLQFIFGKRSNNFFAIQITNSICPRHNVFNFCNKNNFFRPIWNITFCQSVFLFWYSNNITNFQLICFILHQQGSL